MKDTNEQLEWVMGYANAILVALKTHLDSLSNREREKFKKAYEENCNQVRPMISQNFENPKYIIHGFDYASQGLSKTDEEWQDMLNDILRPIFRAE